MSKKVTNRSIVKHVLVFSLVVAFLVLGMGIDSVIALVSSVPGWLTWRPFRLLSLPMMVFLSSLSLMLKSCNEEEIGMLSLH